MGVQTFHCPSRFSWLGLFFTLEFEMSVSKISQNTTPTTFHCGGILPSDLGMEPFDLGTKCQGLGV